jgi:16S rRNA processing protein RimM
MKSVDRRDFAEVGYIIKTHGNKGELKIESSEKIKQWAFLEIQGKPVPFKVHSIQPTHDDVYIIKLVDVDSADKAEALVGYYLLAPKRKLKKSSVPSDELIGYLISDKQYGEIGQVEQLLEMPMQLLIQTTYKNEELLIPAVDEFILDIDDDLKTIFTHLPEGLISE